MVEATAAALAAPAADRARRKEWTFIMNEEKTNVKV
jgi:hypothetical protein